MGTERELTLMAEVEQLNLEVGRLKAELSNLRAIGRKRTRSANAARSSRAAESDEIVLQAVRRQLQRRYPANACNGDLSVIGYPKFEGCPHLGRDTANDLNTRGIPAPRGGKWSPKQVDRSLLRHAARATDFPECDLQGV